jgi:hypothetical protein
MVTTDHMRLASQKCLFASQLDIQPHEEELNVGSISCWPLTTISVTGLSKLAVNNEVSRLKFE